MNPVFLLLGFALGLAVGYVLLTRRHRPKYLLRAEYWVYLPEDRLPAQDRVMERMLRDNPYTQFGRSPIGPAEGLIFSDIRLHIAIVKREDNVHVFRPDLFTELPVNEEVLEALNGAKAFAKLRYLSEEPVTDKRHLQFLLHAADAYAELAGSSLVYDHTAERLYTRTELRDLLSASFDATGPDAHLQARWRFAPEGGYAETRGLLKVGRSDLRTGTMAADQRLLAVEVMEEAARAIWNHPEVHEAVEVEAYSDRFRVLLPEKKDAPVTILRIQPS